MATNGNGQANGADVTQVSKYATEHFESTFKWKLQNFADFPNSLYYTKKIDIVGTKFDW